MSIVMTDPFSTRFRPVFVFRFAFSFTLSETEGENVPLFISDPFNDPFSWPAQGLKVACLFNWRGPFFRSEADVSPA